MSGTTRIRLSSSSQKRLSPCEKARCTEFVMKQMAVVKEEYGIDLYRCRFRQTGVPCADGVPQADPK